MNILVHDENISVDDAKAQAALHGTRITDASLNAAKTLLARMDAQDIAAEAPRAPAAPAPTRPARRQRAVDAPVDTESQQAQAGSGRPAQDLIQDLRRR